MLIYFKKANYKAIETEYINKIIMLRFIIK